MTTAERLTAVAENVQKVYEAGKAAAGPGFTPPASEVLDPDEVYRTTRPADWLPMPTPGDNEMYLLGQIYDGIPAKFAVNIRYSNSGSCLVEIGNLVDGVFRAKDSFTPTSGVAYVYDIPEEEYGDMTSDGYKQYMVRISGVGMQSVLLNYNASVIPDIVDCLCGMRVVLNFGDTQSFNNASQSIRYIRFVGKGMTTQLQGFAGYCVSLMSVSCETPVESVYSTYAFINTKNLLAVDRNFMTYPASYSNFFNNSALPFAPFISESLSNAKAMFRESAIKTIDGRNFGKCTDFTYFVYAARALSAVRDLDISAATTVATAFNNCTNLRHLTFSGDTTPGGWTISLTESALSHAALVEMIDSLPTATAAATITITGNPGASELTDEEIAVATAKNWTITI